MVLVLILMQAKVSLVAELVLGFRLIPLLVIPVAPAEMAQVATVVLVWA